MSWALAHKLRGAGNEGGGGGHRTLVSLVERSEAEEALFPAGARAERLLPQSAGSAAGDTSVAEVVEVPLSGDVRWGGRFTVALPHPFPGDLLTGLTLRFRPRHFLPPNAVDGVRRRVLEPEDPASAWTWAAHLGSAAIEAAELQLCGVPVETLPGEWLHVWGRLAMDPGRGAGWDADLEGGARVPPPGAPPTEDGYLYAHLPFFFARSGGAALPLCALGGADALRVVLTMRPFHEVVRRFGAPRTSPLETPLGGTTTFLNKAAPFRHLVRFIAGATPPPLEDATLLAHVLSVPTPARKRLVQQPYSAPVVVLAHAVFAQPLQYVSTSDSSPSLVTVNLPLTQANGPVREVIWFLRRTAVWRHAEWHTYGAALEDERAPEDPRRDQAPLLHAAELWADSTLLLRSGEEECRARTACLHPGGGRAYDSYVYGFALAEAPSWGAPSGSVNASEVDLRLSLQVALPEPHPLTGAHTEWQVHVFTLQHNVLRCANGLAGLQFSD